MQKIMSLPPVSLGSPEIDWGFVAPNQSETTHFQTSAAGIEYKDDNQSKIPDELERAVALIDDDFRNLNKVTDGSPVSHSLDVRSGYGNIGSILTSALPEAWHLPYPRFQLPSHFHLDLAKDGELGHSMSYTTSSLDATEFMIGEFFVARETTDFSPTNLLGIIIGNYVLLRVQKGLILQPEAGELVRFDPAATVHRAPFRRHDGSGLDHVFLRDRVSIGPLPEKSDTASATNS